MILDWDQKSCGLTGVSIVNRGIREREYRCGTVEHAVPMVRFNLREARRSPLNRFTGRAVAWSLMASF